MSEGKYCLLYKLCMYYVILHNDYINFWHFDHILLVALNKMLNAGLVVGYFCTVALLHYVTVCSGQDVRE